MNLDALAETIETLKERIQKHEDFLRESRTRTRAALVDPLLRSLGWDAADPEMVLPDYRLNEYPLDYALLAEDGEPVAFVRIEALGDLSDSAQTDLLASASEAEIAYACLTDGDRWELYSIEDPTLQIVHISVVDDPAPECALALLGLWQRSLASGKEKKVETPIIVSEEETNLPTNLEPIPEPTPALPTAQPHYRNKWVSMSDYLLMYQMPYREPLPQVIRFPDGSEAPIHRWYDLHVEIAKWLHSKNMLTPDQMPVTAKSGRSYVANSEPITHDGKPMASPERIADGIYVSKHRHASRQLNHVTSLLQHCDVDPSEALLKRGQWNDG